MNKKYIAVMLMALMAVMVSSFAAGASIPLDITKVEVNDFELGTNGDLGVDRGEEIEVEVFVYALDDIEDARLEVSIDGYQYDRYERDLISESKVFDLENDSNKKYTFNLEVPVRMDKDEFDLRVKLTAKKGDGIELLFPIDVAGLDEEDAVVIKDFSVSPSHIVEAGRAVTFKVNVKNYGDKELDDVSVKVSIPELGISDDEFMNELKEEETETFEELLLRIPSCAEAGTYTVEAVVEYDEYESSTETMNLIVTESGLCTAGSSDSISAGRTVITVPESQEVVMGTSGGVYPVMISNLGSSAKTYTLTASGVSAWGTVRFDPAAVVVVQPESVKTVYMYVAANENAQEGSQVFKLSVESQDESKQVVLTANIADDDEGYNGLRRGLEIGLIVLVIILIILGLIIGFNKLRGDRDEEDESQTYY